MPDERSCEVAVLGSANLDVVLRVASLPKPGETVLATGRASGTGGKGANQAIAAARSGAATAFVSALGDDDSGAQLRAALSDCGVDVTQLRTTTTATGAAYVLVDDAGENSIVVDAGANATLVELSAADLAVVADARVLLCQLEVPMSAVATGASHARAAEVLVIVNAAPAAHLPAELLASIDVLVVNEHEATVVGGVQELEAAVSCLVEQVPEVVVTLGAAGALVATRDGGRSAIPPVPARSVVDTTGAGDVFCGAFAAARARGNDTESAARIACAAASLSVETAGAAASAPTLPEIMARLHDL